MIAKLKNFFLEDVSEVTGVYFDGNKIFIVRLTEDFDSEEIDVDGSEVVQIAEKISLVCAQKGWKTSAVGFCLREEEAVTFQTEVDNVPEKEIPALVKSWATAQAGADSIFSFTKIDTELWMETMPRARLEELITAFKKFNLNLSGVSVMPADLLDKILPFDRAKFIAEVVRNKKSPNLLLTRNNVWSWKKISAATAAIFFMVIFVVSIKIFLDWHAAESQLYDIQNSLEKFREDLILKESIDTDIAELHKLNHLAAQIEVNQNFNLLINLGKIAGGNVRLTNINIDENFLELEGLADNPAAVKSYLEKVKTSVIKSARLERSAERDDGDISFEIRAVIEK